MKIIITCTTIALLTGFAIFQFEKEIQVRQRGECVVNALTLLTKVFEDSSNISPGENFLGMPSNDDSQVELAIYHNSNEPHLKSAGWTDRDDVFVAGLIANDRLGGFHKLTYSQAVDSQFVFSTYPVGKINEKMTFIVLRELVWNVRNSLRSTLERMTIVAAVTGLVTAGLFIGVTYILRKGENLNA